MNILTENIGKKSILLIIVICSISILGISTTYSLITSTKKLSSNNYQTAQLDISYSDDKTLDLSSSIPIEDSEGELSEPYVITIKNNGSVSYKFDVSILSTVENIENIINPNYIKIKVDDHKVQKLSDINEGIIYKDLILNANTSLDINIRMWLDIDTPNSEIGHIYSAKLVTSGVAVMNNDTINTQSSAYQTLVKLGLSNNIFNNQGIYEYNTDNEYIYYFKGNIDYNYVKINDNYYRIYLVDNNGNIKIISDDVIGTSKYDDSNIGYVYYDKDLNLVNSNIKEYIENWFENSKINKDILVDNIYCNDTTSQENNLTIYNTYIRYDNNKSDFTCNPSDSYTTSKDIGNGNLLYSIALPTIDELRLIDSEYIYGDSFWTMSPYSNNKMFIYNNGISNKDIDNEIGIKVVMTIDSNNIMGTGSYNDPFIIVS